MKNNILILGKNSFVASNIDTVFDKYSYSVEYFSRGVQNKVDDVIYGDTATLLENTFFAEQYDVIINFVIIKNEGIDKNINYIKQVLELCKKHKVKKLIHFSSIMVYKYTEKTVNEETPIEQLKSTNKKGYGEIKIAVDEYLQSVKNYYDFEIILVRPGYVLDNSRPCPFIKKLPLGISLILGNKRSKQPIIKKEIIHQSIVRIIESQTNNFIYHLFPNNNMTKYQFAIEQGFTRIIVMPKLFFKIVPQLFSKLHIIPLSLYSRFEGMYIETDYSSKNTQEKLKIKF